MNNGIKLYSYTPERLKKFKEQKSEKDEIVPLIDILEKKDGNVSAKLKKNIEENDKNIYVDITNIYKSQESRILLENIISQAINSNYNFIINCNLSKRFYEDFVSYIDEVIPIENIYNSEETNCNFSNLDENKIKLLEKNLKEKLYGHDEFKKEFVRQIKNYSILYNLEEIKIMSLLICGNSGTGKTELAKIVHDTFFSDSNLIKINLGNYKTQGALNSLIGSPKGYYGSERGGELSNKIKNSNSKVILIDEFEKANSDIFNFFYELLEDGKFTDLSENEYNVNGYLIIFTTNLQEKNYKEVIPAPLLSRFTMKALFEPVSNEEKSRYVNEKIKSLVDKYENKYSKKIKFHDVLKNIDMEAVENTSNFRYINRIIQKALISVIEKDN